MVLLSCVVLAPVMGLLNLPLFALSRHMERQADRFAARNGLGEALIAALKRLERDSFSDLNPHPVSVWTEASHPPLAERIRVIQEQEKHV